MIVGDSDTGYCILVARIAACCIAAQAAGIDFQHLFFAALLAAASVVETNSSAAVPSAAAVFAAVTFADSAY